MPAVLSKIGLGNGVAPPASYVQPTEDVKVWFKYFVGVLEAVGGMAGAAWLGRFLYRWIKKRLAAQRQACDTGADGRNDPLPAMAERAGNPAGGPIVELRNLVGRAAPPQDDEESVYHPAMSSIAQLVEGSAASGAPNVGNAVTTEADITDGEVLEPAQANINEA